MDGQLGPMQLSRRAGHCSGCGRCELLVWDLCSRCRAEADEPRTLDAPTEAKPGTLDKLATLAERLEQGKDLWHPADATAPPRPQSFGPRTERFGRLACAPPLADPFGAEAARVQGAG